MADEKVHSEEYFNDYRDYWWNADFLALMAKRWELENVKLCVDAGSGFGHWSRALAPHLPAECEVLGFDLEPRSVGESVARAKQLGLYPRFNYNVGSVYDIPIESGKADMITCQTLIIHLREPKRAITEMLRILKPGGLIALVEPNNLANSIPTTNLDINLEDRIEFIRFQAMCEQGKENLGLGHNSVGDKLPLWLSELGLNDIRVFSSDKCSYLIPPYRSHEEQILAKDEMDFISKGQFMWDKSTAQKYFITGGGSEGRFDLLWSKLSQIRLQQAEKLKSKSYYMSGGNITYLVSGRKT